MPPHVPAGFLPADSPDPAPTRRRSRFRIPRLNSFANSLSGSGPSDLIQVASALAGDRGAMDGVLARLACVVRFTYRLNQRFGLRLPPEELEDVVQQVYAAVWQRLPDFRGTSAFESWVFGFCRNCLRSASRRAHGTGQVELDPVALDLPAGSDEPVTDAGNREGCDRLRAELLRLPAEERQAVELRHLEGQSFEQTARQLGVPASTVKDRCYRGLMKLKNRLRRHDVV
jgi:RNA polymerase sigma-70 factor (ECF subfamily)